MDAYRILRLEAENVKRLSVVAIEPTGDVVEIAGSNRQGKTSVLDAIWWALGGVAGVQQMPVRRGQDKARITVTLGNEGEADLIVERRFTAAGGTSLSVKRSNGDRPASPQKLLDGLMGALTFDPLGFLKAEPKQQSGMLRDLVGLDFTKEEATRARHYQERRDIRRDHDTAKAQLATVVVPADAPEAPVDVSEITKAIEDARAKQREADAREREIEQIRRDAAAAAEVAKRTDAAVEAAKRSLQVAIEQDKVAADRLLQCEAAAAGIDELPPIEVPDVSTLTAQITAANRTNRLYEQAQQARKQRASREAEIAELAARHRALTETISQIDQGKADAIAAAKMPIEGLGFDEEGNITFGGVPLDQASDAEQLEISAAIAAALNPKLRVIRIRDGALLDDDAMARLATFAGQHDMQIWIERVSAATESAIIMEDGHVKGAVAPAGTEAPAEPALV